MHVTFEVLVEKTGRKEWTAQYGQVKATGATKSEAVAALQATIDRFLSTVSQPRYVRLGEYAAVVAQEPDGWYYRILLNRRDATTEDTRLWPNSYPLYATETAALAAAASHLATLQVRHVDEDLWDDFVRRYCPEEVADLRRYRAYAAESASPVAR